MGHPSSRMFMAKLRRKGLIPMHSALHYRRIAPYHLVEDRFALLLHFVHNWFPCLVHHWTVLLSNSPHFHIPGKTSHFSLILRRAVFFAQEVALFGQPVRLRSLRFLGKKYRHTNITTIDLFSVYFPSKCSPLSVISQKVRYCEVMS